MYFQRTVPAVAAIALAAFAAGCGEASRKGGGPPPIPPPAATDVATTATAPAPTTETTATAKPPAGGAQLTVTMNEYSFDPKDATAKAGKVKISAPNKGKVTHEL